MKSIPYGFCGMPCALCTRYRVNGASKCAGCSAGGYYTDVCKVHHCCADKALRHCGECGEYPCARLGKMGDFRDLSTNHVKPRTCAAIAADGIDAWYAEYAERDELLSEALACYNDGRMKRFLCELFIQRELPALRELMRRAEELTGDAKEKGKGFRALAQAMGEAQEGERC